MKIFLIVFMFLIISCSPNKITYYAIKQQNNLTGYLSQSQFVYKSYDDCISACNRLNSINPEIFYFPISKDSSYE